MKKDCIYSNKNKNVNNPSWNDWIQTVQTAYLALASIHSIHNLITLDLSGSGSL